MTEAAPGSYPEPPIYHDEKWTVRATSAGGRLFLYVDDPVGGDDGSLEDVLPWDEIIGKCDPPFLLGDCSGVPSSWVGKKVFKDSCPKSNPDAIAFFHPVLLNADSYPIDGCQYLSGFQGAISTHPCRQHIREALDEDKFRPLATFPTFYFIPNDNVFWAYDGLQVREKRGRYLDRLEDTKFPLCPRGKGLNSIRFFEALRLGRIPVLIADDTKLPLEWMIDYDEFIVRVPEQEIASSNEYIERWLSDHDLVQASRVAQAISDEYFFDPNEFIELCLKELA